MGKGKNGGKYSSTDYDFTKRYPKASEWGTRHRLHKEEWGQHVWFHGSGTRNYQYFDKETGATVIIRADSFEEARQQAASMGLQRKRKKRG